MPKEPTVSVCPNPYHYVDADGVPCATFPEDPNYFGGMQRALGAEVCPVRTVVHSQHDPRTEAPHRQTTVFMFDDGPHTRPASPHYLQGIRTGSLLAADEQTARMAGVKEPMPLEKALARE